MKPTVILLIVVLAAFGALSGYAMLEVGYFGIFAAGLADAGGLQLLVDLVIACTLAMIWMVDDARHRGRTVWPYLVLTLFAGSFGPLLYLLHREWTRAATPALA
ncbi:MAG: DUF2834 domain-containing protein [Burkholderiaceae bacterium]